MAATLITIPQLASFFEYVDPTDQDDNSGLFQSLSGNDAPSEIFNSTGGYYWNPVSLNESGDNEDEDSDDDFDTSSEYDDYGFGDSYNGNYIDLIEISQRTDEESTETDIEITNQIFNEDDLDPSDPIDDSFSDSEFGEFTDLELSPTVGQYFSKLFSGSELADGVFSSPTLAVNSSSFQFQGSLVKDNSSLAGFDSLALGQGVDLPGGGLFLTSGKAKVPAENTSSSYGNSRNQGGNEDLNVFAGNAFQDSESTYDSSVIKFSFTPTDDTESIFLDLVFASDEYYEFKNSSFVDIAAIWFDNQENTKNYADFDGQNQKIQIAKI